MELLVPADSFAALAAARGIGLEVAEPGPGLVLGFGSLTERAIEVGVRELAELVAAAHQRPAALR